MDIPVAAAVIARGTRLLICKRPVQKRHGGLWEFPGGKCEPGETLADAARRELREELGVEVVAVGPPEFAFLDPGSRFLITFVPVEIRGEPMRIEHDALAWGTPAQLLDFPLAPTDRLYVDWCIRKRRGVGEPI